MALTTSCRQQGPITMNLYYTGENGSAASFVEEMESSGTAAAIRAEEGNLRYEYFISREDPETVLLIDSWKDQAALDAHHQTPMMEKIAALREKHGLTMRAERYFRASADLTANDAKYLETKRESTAVQTVDFSVWPKGEPNGAYAQYFVGNSYLAPMEGGIANVTFEPGCRNNWHIHQSDEGGGQLLICVSGRGWYQEWGKQAIELKPGDVVNIPANVKHWHGAAKGSWFQHIAQEIPGVNTKTEWCEKVDEDTLPE